MKEERIKKRLRLEPRNGVTVKIEYTARVLQKKGDGQSRGLLADMGIAARHFKKSQTFVNHFIVFLGKNFNRLWQAVLVSKICLDNM